MNPKDEWQSLREFVEDPQFFETKRSVEEELSGLDEATKAKLDDFHNSLHRGRETRQERGQPLQDSLTEEELLDMRDRARELYQLGVHSRTVRTVWFPILEMYEEAQNS